MFSSSSSFTDNGTVDITMDEKQIDEEEENEDEAFPIDRDSNVKEQELKFLLQNGYEERTCQHSSFYLTIYSRAHQKYYVQTKSTRNIQISDFAIFNLGHTLQYANYYNYARLFVLDVDCLCKREKHETISHIDENHAFYVAKCAYDEIRRSIPEVDPLYTIFGRECGFHIYFNIPVSFFMNTLLLKRINESLKSTNFIIECPQFMPLPYSAKMSGLRYEPLSPKKKKCHPNINYSFTYNDKFYFYDCVDMSDDSYNSDTCLIKINYENESVMYIKYTPSVKQFTETLFYKFKYKIKSIEYSDKSLWKYPFEAIAEIWTKYYRDRNEWQVGPKHITKTLIEKTKEKETEDDSVIQVELTENDKQIYSVFFLKINKIVFLENHSDNPSLFIHYSKRFNYINFQHYLAAFYSYFITKIDINEMKRFLGIIYDTNNEIVKRNILYFDQITYKFYPELNEILSYLNVLFVYDIHPDDSIDKIINTYLESKLNLDTDSFIKILNSSDKIKYKNYLNNFCEIYINALKDLHLCIYTNKEFYVFINDYYDKDHKKLPSLHNWFDVNLYADIEKITKRIINFKAHEFYHDNPWCLGTHMFQTQVGVFNSVTGLVTKTSFLLKFKQLRIFPFYKNIDIFINDKIIDMQKKSNFCYNILKEKLTDMFMYFRVVPAIMELGTSDIIEEHDVEEMILILSELSDDHSVFFFIDLYKIHPMFIYNTMLFIDKYNFTGCYVTLIMTIFKQNITEPWDEFFDIYKNVLFEKKESYMKTLQTLKTPNSNNIFSKQFCLHSFIVSLLIIKCPKFKNYVNNFIKYYELSSEENLLNYYTSKDFKENEKLTEIQSIFNLYLKNKIKKETNAGAYLQCNKTFYKIMKCKIFGENLSVDESTFVELIFRLCSSFNFTRYKIYLFLDILTTYYLPINENRFINILYGTGDNGKTHWCEIINCLFAGSVCQINNLDSNEARSHIASSYSAVIVNEIKYLTENIMKAISGNDKSDYSTFYTQKLTPSTHNSALFGATNCVISFKNKNIDTASIKRFLVIELIGKIRNDCNISCKDFFINFIKKEYLIGVTQNVPRVLSHYLCFLIFSRFLDNRNSLYVTNIDIHNEDTENYQKEVYRENNIFYNFIHNMGLRFAPNFFMKSKDILNLARKYIDENNKFIKNINQFIDEFFKFKKVNLFNDEYVDDIQQENVIEYIKINFSTISCINKYISNVDLQKKLSLVKQSTLQANAVRFFKSQNTFDSILKIYPNKMFVKQNWDNEEHASDDENIINCTSSSSFPVATIINEFDDEDDRITTTTTNLCKTSYTFSNSSNGGSVKVSSKKKAKFYTSVLNL
ncbi:unknown [Gryllus bimaculatus nudivirus]|uniref:Uncharacterized protein n=1 Tax=Gryllus bimaculatus nudivirus TaxID=432587 RepID=A4L251_9VIRU|nr:hypothetical protein GrBNV_gp88 [Gryllus bimaculatus nudivirus]ABO45421.1 unknown [Gryllus bimaculatus nudivirus]